MTIRYCAPRIFAGTPIINFKGAHYPRDVILCAVFFYVRYPVSYRDLDEIRAERGVIVDDATLHRWVVKFAPLVAATTRFFTRTISNNGWPDRVVIDKSDANNAGLENMNLILALFGWCWLIETLQAKYLNNITEQDHRFIKRITRRMKGFSPFSQPTRRSPELRQLT